MEINEKIDLEKLIDKIQDKRFRFSCKNGIIPNVVIIDYRLKELIEKEVGQYMKKICYIETTKDKILGLDFITVSEKDYIGVAFVEG